MTRGLPVGVRPGDHGAIGLSERAVGPDDDAVTADDEGRADEPGGLVVGEVGAGQPPAPQGLRGGPRVDVDVREKIARVPSSVEDFAPLVFNAAGAAMDSSIVYRRWQEPEPEYRGEHELWFVDGDDLRREFDRAFDQLPEASVAWTRDEALDWVRDWVDEHPRFDDVAQLFWDALQRRLGLGAPAAVLGDDTGGVLAAGTVAIEDRAPEPASETEDEAEADGA